MLQDFVCFKGDFASKSPRFQYSTVCALARAHFIDIDTAGEAISQAKQDSFLYQQVICI